MLAFRRPTWAEYAVIALAIGTAILGSYVHSALVTSTLAMSSQQTYSTCVARRRQEFLALQAVKDRVEDAWFDKLATAEILPILSPARQTIREAAFAQRSKDQVYIRREQARLSTLQC